jgi:pimeloyl-ACP methyl ester carboxylesterase
MYYEVHGENRTGTPVLLIHGAFQSTGTLGPILPGLAATRQVIVADLQGHSRTADVDRPLTYEGMADDCAALLRHLGGTQADVVGFSMGGPTAIQIAIRHPELVRTLVPISAAFRLDGWQPELLAMAPTMSPEMFAGSPFEAAYKEIAPNPEDFPVLVEKIKGIDTTPFDWRADFLGIAAPALIVVGDADVTRPEHAVEMLRLLGGGAMGDMTGIPKARLAVLPGTTHFIPPGYGVLDRHEWFLPMITAFLDAPEPVPGMAEGAQ